ncbi:MAG TPA: hypothetical protein VMI33_18245 [Streptosporangiaceae bacterium]|nr:hypothetical protein [Streptosporangiaceae bacterium]
MTNSDCPWEPPVAGTGPEQILGALGRLRTTFRWKADDLDAAGLRARIGASSLGPRRSRARLDVALAKGGLDQPVHASWPDGRHASLPRQLGPDRLR